MPRSAAVCLAGLALVGAAAFPASAWTASAARPLPADDSVVASIRMRARGGDFSTAFTLIDRLGRDSLRAKALAALAGEYSAIGSKDLADEQFAAAERLVANSAMRAAERASALAHIARELSRSSEHASKASGTFARAVAVTEVLAGYDLDFTLAELAIISVRINGNWEQARGLAQKISMEKLRAKVLDVLTVDEQ